MTRCPDLSEYASAALEITGKTVDEPETLTVVGGAEQAENVTAAATLADRKSLCIIVSQSCYFLRVVNGRGDELEIN